MNDSVRALFSDISRYTEMINEDHVKNAMQTRNLTHYYATPQHNIYTREEAVLVHPNQMYNPVEPKVPYNEPPPRPTYHEGAIPMTPWQWESEHTTLDHSDFDGLLSYLSDDSLDSTNSNDLEPDYSLFQ